MRRGLTLSLIAIATQAQATLPPCVTDDLMREAVMVVQIVDHSVVAFPNNICRVSGTIAQVHRGIVEVGRTLTADFACITDASNVAIGGTRYVDASALTRAAAVEVHINRDGYIAAEGAGLIGLTAPTATIAWEPYCD